MRRRLQCMFALALACVLLVPAVYATGVSLHLVLEEHHSGQHRHSEEHHHSGQHHHSGESHHSEALHLTQGEAGPISASCHDHAIEVASEDHVISTSAQKVVWRWTLAAASMHTRLVLSDRSSLDAPESLPERPPSVPLFTAYCSLLN